MDFGRIIGDSSIFPIEHRMLNIILILGIAISFLSTIFYNLFDVAPILHLVTVASSISLLALYYFSMKRKKVGAIKLFIMLWGFLSIPPTWNYGGGINGWAPYFVILYNSMVSIFLRGINRIITLAAFNIMLLAMILYDAVPIRPYGMNYFGLVLTTAIMVLFFSLILNYYIKEKNRAKDYLAKLEKQTIELKMARLDRLNLIGEMAASIGHEVRNPLTTVRGFLQYFQKKSKYADDAPNFAIMIEELDRANAIITEFLSLAKNRKINLKPLNLNQTIEQLRLLIYTSVLSEGKNFVVDLQAVPDIMADENEIKQLILNLTRNAREAVAQSGTISVTTKAIEDKVLLTICDNGRGIPPEVYEKLGTPFLTTKEKGTGLGIAICYRIIERHKAKVEVDTCSVGTTFTIIFAAA